MTFLQHVQELLSVYEAEIKLLTDMVNQTVAKTVSNSHSHSHSNINNQPSGKIRSADEFVFSLSKACQQELEVEQKLEMMLDVNEVTTTDDGNSDVFSIVKKNKEGGGGRGGRAQSSASKSNPLLLVLRNVF
jgi:hypothetical protein